MGGACWWERDLKGDAVGGSAIAMAGGTDRGLGRTVLVGEAKGREPDQSRQTVRHTPGSCSGRAAKVKRCFFLFQLVAKVSFFRPKV